jgi:hypothetical protein
MRPYRGSPRPIGLPPLQLPSLHLNTTAFLCIEEYRKGGAVTVPQATAFFVVDRNIQRPHPIWVVTGRHCIQEARADGRPFFLRVNTNDGTLDIPMTPDNWHESDKADVAVALWEAHVGAVLTAVPLDQFVSSDYRYYGSNEFPQVRELGGQAVHVGHEVFFVGLFTQHAGKSRNLPVARFGHVSRLPLESIAVKRRDGSIEHIDGYLAEARSWGGHSGSPVFWYYPAPTVHMMPNPHFAQQSREVRRREKTPEQIPVSHAGGLVALLGLVSAHFDIPLKAETRDDIPGEVTTKINAGMSVVTPAHTMQALLEREDVVKERDEFRAKAEGEDVPAATFDMFGGETQIETEYDRFEDLTRKD